MVQVPATERGVSVEELVVYSSHLPLEHTAEDKVRKLAIPVAAKLRALRLVYLGSDVGLRSDAFGGGDGSVSIVFYSEETCLEAVVEADGSASFLVKRGLGYQVEIEEESESASDQEIDSWLHHIAGRPTWNSSESSDWTCGTIDSGDSATLLSSAPPEPIPIPLMGYGGISVLDARCVEDDGRGSVCGHIVRWYGDGFPEPVAHWRFRLEDLQPPLDDRCLVAVPSASGDVCHRNLHCRSLNQAKNEFLRLIGVWPESIRICDSGDREFARPQPDEETQERPKRPQRPRRRH